MGGLDFCCEPLRLFPVKTQQRFTKPEKQDIFQKKKLEKNLSNLGQWRPKLPVTKEIAN